MKNLMYWGLGVLIVGLVIGLVFLGRQTDTEPEKVYKEPSEEVIKQAQQANKPTRPAREGYKWVPHNDHWDEVPIAQAQDDEPHETPIVTDDAPSESEEYVPSAEELARVREIHKVYFPKMIKQLEARIPKLEELHRNLLKGSQINPDYTDPLRQQMLDNTERELASDRAMLLRFQDMYNKLMEAEDEQK